MTIVGFDTMMKNIIVIHDYHITTYAYTYVCVYELPFQQSRISYVNRPRRVQFDVLDSFSPEPKC